MKKKVIKKAEDLHILTIDQSLNGSACVYTINGIIKGKWYMTQHRRNITDIGTFIDVKKINDLERLTLIKQWFSVILSNVDPKTYMALEGYAYAGSGRVFELGELGGMIKLLIYEGGFRFIAIPPDSVKLFATEKGTATKSMMVASAIMKHNIDFSMYAENGEDLADAFWINILIKTLVEAKKNPALLKKLPENQRRAIADKKGKKQNPSLLEVGFIYKMK